MLNQVILVGRVYRELAPLTEEYDKIILKVTRLDDKDVDYTIPILIPNKLRDNIKEFDSDSSVLKRDCIIGVRGHLSSDTAGLDIAIIAEKLSLLTKAKKELRKEVRR